RLIGRARSDFKLLRRRGVNLMSAASRRAFLKSVLRAIAEFGSAAAGCAILLVSIVSGLTPATAAAGLAIIAIVSLPLRELADVWDIHSAWLIAREKSEKIFSKAVLDRTREGIKLPNVPITVSLENVSAGPIDQLSLAIEAGSKTAIVDQCSTQRDWLFNLCAGLVDVCQGNVKYNGVDLNEIRMANFAQRTHILTLNDPILQGSLRRNLTLGIRRRPKDSAIVKICKAFGFSATWERLGGLDGRVYEGGRNMSVSEKFRLLVIRAALKNSSLLIVNDPGDVLGEPDRTTLLRLVNFSARTVIVFTQDNVLVEKMGAAFDMINFGNKKAYSMIPEKLEETM
ncbi:MAG: ATP-binding cassette domain-containing protein, partial [Betaproteobacteria bacterium]|nr:ATP-binding cassette domain-containing protein [Betaproteobacteria bacterium]